jgi:hypothetical protein
MGEPLRHRQTKGAANRHARPTATAPHSDSTMIRPIAAECAYGEAAPIPDLPAFTVARRKRSPPSGHSPGSRLNEPRSKLGEETAGRGSSFVA